MWLTACSTSTDGQVLRHLVTAELIEREHVPETHIRVEDIRIERGQAFVRVAVRGQGGRLGIQRTYRCELEREENRWVIRSAEAK